MTPSEFAAKWKGSTRNERAAAQEHFINLCQMLGVQTPNEADPHGDWYAFEKGAEKLNGEDGFADVWKRDHFGWEYKGKRKDLAAAYQQLLQYRESLENPPLLVVCDLDRFEVHTNFTGTKAAVHSFTLDDLRTAPAEPLKILRAVMQDPEALRPKKTRAQITEEVAQQFAGLAEKLRADGHDPQKVAHFLNRLLFCFFAEDVGVLPRGLMTRILQATHAHPAKFTAQLKDLFSKMHAGGGFFGAEEIEWFNGGLFDDDEVLPLAPAELDILLGAAKMDWSSVEPAILGTLFERGLDPAKRSQLGAHYTDKTSILRIVEPVVLKPLRREFEQAKARIQKLLASGKKATAEAKGKDNPNRVFREFLARLRAVRVLDPACGSGNFLYVTLQLLKDLEKEVILWGAETMHTPQEFPGVGPEAVRGIELNSYAAELARVTIWIGEIQWMVNNGFAYRTNPVLRPLETVERRDAVLERTENSAPRQASWPDAEFVVGNPPFLGGKKMREGLGDEYVDALFKAWDGRVPREADFVSYWHEKAREQIERGKTKRTGLLATQSIRQGANREVLARVKETGDIFLAWSDEPWVVEGADVRVSIVGQDDGTEKERVLDGEPVEVIYTDLRGGAAGLPDLTTARPLRENANIIFMGTTKGGPFDIDETTASEFLTAPKNVNGRPNSDVVKPWVNGKAITARRPQKYIIDFGVDVSAGEAAKYEKPFEYVRATVKPAREKSRTTIESWWLHERARGEMRAALAGLPRFVVTPRVAAHRLFVFAPAHTLPDSRLYAFARADDFFFGVLHSRVHEVWALATSSRHGVGNDPTYNAATCFAPFPFPWALNTPDANPTKEQARKRDAIAEAAKALDDARGVWLNPLELLKEQPALAPGMPKRFAPKDAAAAKVLKTRTLTDLYNARPAWLDNLHRELDRAVLAAYGWPEDISDADILRKLLELNQHRPPAPRKRKADDDE